MKGSSRFSRLAAAAFVLAAACAAAAPAAPPLQDKSVLYVVGAGPDRATDERVKQHLESLGARVTVAEQVVQPDRHALVVISATVDERVALGDLKNLPVPVLTNESQVLPALGMTGSQAGVDHGVTEKADTYLFMANAPHPLSAGLPPGTFVATNSSVPMNWGKPAPAAAIISTPPGFPDKAVIFAYEKGALMAGGFPAPARRVSFFLHDKAFDKLDAVAQGRQTQGLQLFEAALRWALATPAGASATPPAKGRKVLLVTLKESPNPKPGVKAAVARTNKAMVEHLKARGHTVTVADEGDSATKAQAQDVVIIAATIRANRMLGRYKQVGVPIVNLENDILDDMGMTGKRRWSDFGEIEGEHPSIVNAPHALAAGLPAGKAAFFKSEAALGFGQPGSGAIVVATASGDPRKAVYFAYEKGATMDYDFVAPARRVYFPIDFDKFDQLNETGLALFDAAVQWAASGTRSAR